MINMQRPVAVEGEDREDKNGFLREGKCPWKTLDIINVLAYYKC